MRIPQVFDINIVENYEPSEVSLDLEGEKENQSTENYDSGTFPSLKVRCLKCIANNFHTLSYIYLKLSKKDQNFINELISTDLTLHLAVKLIQSEQYWKRRYQSQFNVLPLHPHFGWNWKCLYLEQYLSSALEKIEPEYFDEDIFISLANLCFPFIHGLVITQLQSYNLPKYLLDVELPETYKHHINLIPVIKNLQYLTKIELCYGIQNLGSYSEPVQSEVAVDDCKNVGQAINKLKHLKVLKIHNSKITCKHVHALVKEIMHNTSLIELDLSDCQIGDLGAKCIAMLLNVHEKLKHLILRNNLIGEDGVLGIAMALLVPEGSQIQKLDLSMNPLGPGGCRNLVHALVRGNNPRDLYLSSCHIYGEGIDFITNMLMINTSLRTFDISGNFFGHAGGKKLVECLASNRRLVQLDLQKTQISDETQKEIKKILERNMKINPLDTSSELSVMLVSMTTNDKEREMDDIDYRNSENNLSKYLYDGEILCGSNFNGCISEMAV